MKLFFKPCYLNKIYKVMRLSFIFIFVILVQAAATSYAQSINLDVSNMEIRQVIKNIEQQSDYRFFYTDGLSDLSRKVNMKITDKNIDQVLLALFDNTQLGYQLVDNKLIMLAPKGILQQIVITGVVTDAAGEPLPGVSVMIKGTTQGTATDVNGAYSLPVRDENATLVFSYIGYVMQEIIAGNRRTINVTLVDDTRQIDEVVVVGYGMQKKVNLTGAVSTVDIGKMTESRPITNLSAGLSGLAAGVSITQNKGGRPGSDGAVIRVRGQGTLNNSDPLVIIDGVQSDMSYINPQDVESITVLKDAASSAIYGSRAANGVILINTKKGKEGTTHISYNGYMSAETLANRVNMVSNYADYMTLVNEAITNSNPKAPKPYSQGKIDEWRNAGNSDPLKYPNTDWQDEIYKLGWMQNHTLSIHGGTPKTRYFISGNYLKNPGIMENTGYDRMSARVNMDVDVMPWFKLGVNSFGSKGVSDVGELSELGRHTTPGIVFRAPDGRYGGINNTEDDINAGNNNPLRTLNGKKGNLTAHKLFARFFGQLNPLKGLTIDGSFTYDLVDNYKYVQPVFIDTWNFYTNTIQQNGTGRTSVTNRNEKYIKQQMDGLIRYETNVSSLNIQAMAGASQEAYRFEWFEASKLDLVAPELTVLNAATANATATGNYTNWAMRSYFGRLNLNWADKYLFEANMRMDYSSRFASGKTRRGIFPSFSAGWRINEEDFMRDISGVSNLKLRASYGGLGNNRLGADSDKDGNYSYMALYAASNYVLNGSPQIGFAQTKLSNAAVTWETTYVSNIGVDFGLLKHKLNGSLDYFVKNTKNILIDLPAPLVHGAASIPKMNVGEVRNAGVELVLQWEDKIGEVGYFIGGNFSHIKNKVTKFKGLESSISGTNMILEGEPINIQYVMKVDRIVQTNEDLALVQAMVDKNPTAFKNFPRPQLGDFLYADTDGDGILTNDDRIKVGNGTNPTVLYGFNWGLNWKGFDVSCLMQGVSGLRVYWDGEDAPYFRPTTRAGTQINKTIADGRWYKGRPTKAIYPRLIDYSDNRNDVASDFWIEDKSYFRVKNIQLGYTVPNRISRKALLQTLRFYASIDNALTITNYRGLDPEEDGVSRYPTFRMTTFGVNLTF